MNSMSFSLEDVKNGLMTKFVNNLIEYNTKADGKFVDIRIWTDGCTHVVDWCERHFEPRFEDEKFVCLNASNGESVVLTVYLPDDSCEYAMDEYDKERIIADYERENPNWEYCWVDGMWRQRSSKEEKEVE